MTSPRLLTRVRSQLADLSAAEQRLAQCLLERPQWVLGGTAQEWADAAQVSAASAVRLCRSLGFEGLKDFRLALAVELREITQGERPLVRSLAEQVMDANIAALRETVELLDSAALEQAACWLDGASLIEIFALGLSSPIALDAVYRFQRLGLPAAYCVDAHMQAVKAASLPPGGVALIISHSGRTPEMLRVARSIQGRGLKVLALTSSPGSPLAALADLALIAATSEAQVQPESRSSRIAHLAILDTLCAALIELKPAETARALAQARAAEALLLRGS